MSLYSDYIKEREGFETLEFPFGFVTFKCAKDECYLRDLYVVPEKRRLSVASSMADKVADIAHERGCKYFITSVCTSANNSNISIYTVLKYGFKPFKSTAELIYFVKDV